MFHQPKVEARNNKKSREREREREREYPFFQENVKRYSMKCQIITVMLCNRILYLFI